MKSILVRLSPLLLLLPAVAASLSFDHHSPASSFLSKRNVCTKDSQCTARTTAHSHQVCSHHVCTTVCNTGFVSSHGKCVEKTCHPSQCHQRIPSHSTHICTASKDCSFKCNPGYHQVGNQCELIKTCHPSQCHGKIPAHSVHTCNAEHECSFACVSGYTLRNGACVPAACKASNCHERLPANAHAICKNHACDFACNGGFYRSGDHCKAVPAKCTSSNQCKASHPAHSYNRCHDETCGWVCVTGYHQEGSVCVPNSSTCSASTCDPISHGSVTCKNDECAYSCIAGYKLFTVGGKKECLDLSTDPLNCGTVGHVCPPDYTHHGKPVCKAGACTLLCPGKERPHHHHPSAPYYCA